ncbi:hypothetical protein OPS25_15770 [Alteromonas ponticola]|uniref:Uncharacterized protein n=1 Tax=Alteromonas aquimaris TaxID=2998417 RepID=A0ABT3PB12_9ALTE|nr:hypothetical protein [Alteromonas aquimaris]MCW8109964.1 hypothetical protein [Alteromonas aquimaris]
MFLVVFSVIGILVIALIYFVLKAQTHQRELMLVRSTAKSNAKKAHIAFTNLVTLSSELQNVFSQRLEVANSKGLIVGDDFNAAKTVIKLLSDVVMDCCEKGRTVEEVLTHRLKNNNVSLKDVKNYIKGRPNDVRVSWSKNTPEGFITACNLFSQSSLNVNKTDQKLEAS